ncbi:hypothetical protein [Streptomyces sp. S465]|uniref:hypothetical protein n=1 Tax=Streptomyces sp. S465 TaxID=2979468 RepID=UPI0022A8929B|nr:hypothetical protein [Streptomyces sp. S465]WAP56806.1 hypothetical protein N6H00_18600 [Streptomyces sp. S465]
MTAGRDHNDGCDLDRLHRDEITVAMNWVIRACQDVIRDHSRKANWVPISTPTGTAPTTDHLIQSARTDVLGQLQRQIDGVEAIIGNAEHERAKMKR